jgi:hypothetical protein
MKKLIYNSLAFTLLILALTITSCRKDEALFVSTPTEFLDAQVAHDWNDMFRSLTKKTTGFTPPVASRALGYAGVTLYETVVPGMPNFQSLQGQLTQMPEMPKTDPTLEYNWAIAANFAMGYVARNFYPTMPADQVLVVQNLEDASFERLKIGVSKDIIARSKEWGLTVAKAIFEWSKTDGGHEGYNKNFPANYTPPVGPGKWVSTYPAFQPALQPFWGDNRTFIPQCAQNTQPEAPLSYSDVTSSAFHTAAMEVYNTVKNRTPTQELIANYWSDDPGMPGTPPGHMVSIATLAAKAENYNLAKAAEVYAKVGIAVADAFVSCWKCKYIHNYMRPISYIRSNIDLTWVSVLSTPPFPEYTSGHSVQSGAAARVLSDLFGTTYAFVDNTHASRTDINGTPRAFKSFNEMASEAAISRLYGGIHFREAIEKGVEQGTRVGVEVGKLKFRK